MDEWTPDKWGQVTPELQYHTLFAINRNLVDALKDRIDLQRIRYEYSINNMVENKVEQANYLYSCEKFKKFGEGFLSFLGGEQTVYGPFDDLYQYMIDNHATDSLISAFNSVFVHKADNRDFFEWEVVASGMLMPDPEKLIRFESAVATQFLTVGVPLTPIQLPEAILGQPPMTYTLDPSPPAGLSFDATTRILSGTPTTPMEITPYTYTAVDTYSRTIHLEFEISVAGFESEVATQFLTVGVPFTPIQLPEAIGGQPPMTYTLDPSPPAGLSFDATTRILSGTPTTPMDRTTYTYTALDTDSRPIYLDFEISVAGAVQFQSTVTDYSFPRATPISPIILPAATGGTAPVIYNLHPKLPSDLSFADSTLTITGTPFFVTDNTQYTYFAIDVNGSADTLQFSLMIYSPVSIQTETLPTTFALKSNYPNPFKRSTRIMFDLPSKAKISVEVLDVAGRLMRRIPAQTIPAGWSQGVDFNGADLPSGMYVYRVQIVSTEGVQDTHTGRFIVVR